MKLNTHYQLIANKLGILMKLQNWVVEETSWCNILNIYEALDLAPHNYSGFFPKAFDKALLMMRWVGLAIILHQTPPTSSFHWIRSGSPTHMKRRDLPSSRVAHWCRKSYRKDPRNSPNWTRTFEVTELRPQLVTTPKTQRAGKTWQS